MSKYPNANDFVPAMFQSPKPVSETPRCQNKEKPMSKYAIFNQKSTGNAMYDEILLIVKQIKDLILIIAPWPIPVSVSVENEDEDILRIVRDI